MLLQLGHQRIPGRVAGRQHDIGLDQRAALGIRLGHHGRVGHGRVLDQAVFDLAGPDAVAGGLEHVVGAPLVPEVAVGVAGGQVAGAAPVAGVLAAGGALVAPVAEEEDRVGVAVHVVAVHRHVARHVRRALVALVVDHRDAVAGIRPPHAARPRRPADPAFGAAVHAAVADHVVDLGLAEHLVDHHPELVTAVREHGVADRLAGAHDGLQLQAELASRLRVGLQHGLERGGEQEGVGDPVFLHQRERGVRAEAAVVGNDGAAEIEAGQERIHQPPGPGPVGWRPEHGGVLGVAGAGRLPVRDRPRPNPPPREGGLRGQFGIGREAEPVLAAHEARQIAEQGAVRDQRALRRTGGAAGVDQHGALVGLGARGGEGGRLLRQFHAPVQVGLQRGGPDTDQGAQGRTGRAHRQQVGDGTFVAHRQHRAAVLQPVLQRLGAEQHRQRHGHRAQLEDRHVGDGGLEALRHHQRHPVAPLHAQRGQHVGQAVGLRLQRAEGQGGLALHRVGSDGGAAVAVGPLRPARAARLRDVEVLRHRPAELRVHLPPVVLVAALTDRHRSPSYHSPQCTNPAERRAASLSRSAARATTSASGANRTRTGCRW